MGASVTIFISNKDETPLTLTVLISPQPLSSTFKND
jgi:hypothetical protein